jgi:hypothetical protein
VADPSDYKRILKDAGKSVTLDEASVMYHAAHKVVRLPTKCHQAAAGVIYECDCVDFHEEFVCKHVLALALHRKEITVPAAFDGVWFNDQAGHRERGRPVGAGRQMPPAFTLDAFDMNTV